MKDKDKYEILYKNYNLLNEDISRAYSVLQQRIAITITAFAFLFTSYITALSQWSDFRNLIGFDLIVLCLMIIAFISLCAASFATIFKSVKSLGNPRDTIKALKNTDGLEEYYELKVNEWKSTIENNNSINKIINICIFLTSVLLLFSLTCSSCQILVTIITSYNV